MNAKDLLESLLSGALLNNKPEVAAALGLLRDPVAEMAAPKTCDTCKRWSGGFGFERGKKHRDCKNPKLSTDDKFHDDGASAPWLVSTGPKFGCIHHESK